MSDKPKTLEQAFESFEKAFTPPISLTFNEKLLVEIFWNAAIESRNEEITGLKIKLIESDAKIESMQSELDKRDARIEKLEEFKENILHAYRGHDICAMAHWIKATLEKELTQGSKDGIHS